MSTRELFIRDYLPQLYGEILVRVIVVPALFPEMRIATGDLGILLCPICAKVSLYSLFLSVTNVDDHLSCTQEDGPAIKNRIVPQYVWYRTGAAGVLKKGLRTLDWEVLEFVILL